ncbi:hypothetical protein [Paenibacillus xanthanilyticus]|uniref:Uncharacterized protein n=1 Tax=Paenibacillus xanthanilyticus TaxID=1783531 RepID=A0ABV8KCL9_9BACL
MNEPQPIKLVYGPMEPGSHRFYLYDAFLVEENYAFHRDPMYGEIWIDRVKPLTPSGTYIKDWDGGGSILAKGIAADDVEETVRRIYRDLTGMRGFDIVTRVLMTIGIDIDMYEKKGGANGDADIDSN